MTAEIPPYPAPEVPRELGPYLPPETPREAPGIGVRFGASRPNAPKAFRSLDLPPHPGGQIKLPTIPPPPQLDPALSDNEKLAYLANCYRQAVENRTGKKCWLYARKGQIQKHPRRRALLAAAALMIEHGIPPSAWAAFACDVWTRYGRAGYAPIAFVFAPKFVDEKKDWYGREALSYSGGQVLMGPKMKALAERFELMRLEAMRSSTATPKVFKRWFPGKLYERMLTEAKEEAARHWAEIRKAVKEGFYPW